MLNLLLFLANLFSYLSDYQAPPPIGKCATDIRFDMPTLPLLQVIVGLHPSAVFGIEIFWIDLSDVLIYVCKLYVFLQQLIS